MAFVVIVEAAAPVASWRVPEALTYHRSLPLPPYTTLVGMLGAALGLALPGAYQFLKERRIRLGVGGWSEGQGRDLWKFQKLKDKEVESDVLLREFWVETRLALVIEAQDEETAQIIGRAFQTPAFPLTAGPSDSLLKAVAVRVEALDPVSTRSLAYTLIFREISPRYGLHDSWEDLPIHRTIRAPAIERLPSGFAFEADSPRRSWPEKRSPSLPILSTSTRGRKRSRATGSLRNPGSSARVPPTPPGRRNSLGSSLCTVTTPRRCRRNPPRHCPCQKGRPRERAEATDLPRARDRRLRGLVRPGGRALWAH